MQSTNGGYNKSGAGTEVFNHTNTRKSDCAPTDPCIIYNKSGAGEEVFNHTKTSNSCCAPTDLCITWLCVLQDEAHLRRVKWQYMILDEAQVSWPGVQALSCGVSCVTMRTRSKSRQTWLVLRFKVVHRTCVGWLRLPMWLQFMLVFLLNRQGLMSFFPHHCKVLLQRFVQQVPSLTHAFLYVLTGD